MLLYIFSIFRSSNTTEAFLALFLISFPFTTIHFWATVCKTVRPLLADRCLSCPVLCVCLPVCDVGVLWPNGWTDQDETWHGGRPRSRPHRAGWGPSCLQKGAQLLQFSAHVRYDQTAEWIKMPLGMEVGLAQTTLC